MELAEIEALEQSLDGKAPAASEPAPKVEVETKPETAIVETPKPEDTPEKAAEAEVQRDEKGRFIPLNRHKDILENIRGPYEARIKELEAKISQQTPAKRIESLEKLRQDMPPEFVDAIEAELIARDQRLQALEQENQVFRTERERLEQEQLQAEADRVTKALNSTPTLKTWQDAYYKEGATDEQKALFKAAMAYDDQMKQSPVWADKPLADRFAEIERRVAADMGIALATPKTTTQNQPKPLPARAAAPASLSNLPGGSTPKPPDNTLETHDPMALITGLQGMSDEQVRDYFARRT